MTQTNYDQDSLIVSWWSSLLALPSFQFPSDMRDMQSAGPWSSQLYQNVGGSINNARDSTSENGIPGVYQNSEQKKV